MARFPDGARVVFLGDSLVASNLPLWHIVHHYVTHYPEAGVKFYNCGVSGGTVGTLLQFREPDIYIHRPTHAVIALGVNDSGRDMLSQPATPERYAALESRFEKYKADMRALCEDLLAHGVEVILCTPAPYAEYQAEGGEPLRGGYALMLGYADYCRALAKELGLAQCDYHAELTKLLQTETLYSPDRVHPTEHGYYKLAGIFLAWQGEEIGEEIPMPDYLAEWHDLTRRRRMVYGAEWMIVKHFDWPTEEKMQYARKYIDEKLYPREVHKNFAQAFLDNKPREAEILARIVELTESGWKA